MTALTTTQTYENAQVDSPPNKFDGDHSNIKSFQITILLFPDKNITNAVEMEMQ